MAAAEQHAGHCLAGNWRGVGKLTHREPLSAAGCPVGWAAQESLSPRSPACCVSRQGQRQVDFSPRPSGTLSPLHPLDISKSGCVLVLYEFAFSKTAQLHYCDDAQSLKAGS